MTKKTNAVRSILVNPHHGNEGQITDAVRRNLMRYAIFETVSRKSTDVYEEPTIREFRIVGLETAPGLRNNLPHRSLS